MEMIKGSFLTLAIIFLFFGLLTTTVIMAVAITKTIIAIVEYIRGIDATSR